jgi:hypothetical protein
MSSLRIQHLAIEEIDDVLAFWRLAAEGTSIADDTTGLLHL